MLQIRKGLQRINRSNIVFFFFFNDTATTEIYTLSLHDALPISPPGPRARRIGDYVHRRRELAVPYTGGCEERRRSEEHTSELQSHLNLVCRLLLEKKKTTMEAQSSSELTERRRHRSIGMTEGTS